LGESPGRSLLSRCVGGKCGDEHGGVKGVFHGRQYVAGSSGARGRAYSQLLRRLLWGDLSGREIAVTA
jgi:hypothetical protein